jgi:hypothetical protein
MSYDPMEWTVRDPLEETVPDPVERPRRLRGRRRRAVEATALVLLVPGFLTVQWIDDVHQSRPWQTRERVTVVARGGTGTLGRVRLRMLGRDAATAHPDPGAPAGSVQLKLIIAAQPLDAQGVKQLPAIAYAVRDRAGHVWAAGGLTDRDVKPAAGVASQVSVLATVPQAVVTSVVLEARPGGQAQRGSSTPVPVLRFAH